MRDTATKAVRLAAARFDVDFFDALDLKGGNCVSARWSAWLALLGLGWRPEVVARLFYLHRTAVLYASKSAGLDVRAHAKAIAATLAGAANAA